MRRRSFFAVSLAALIAACVTAPAPEPPRAEVAARPAGDCAATVFPDDRWVGPAYTDKYNGRYWSGERALDVRREGQRLFVVRPDGAARQLQRTGTIPGAGTFRDGCGAAYDFVLPPDGPGGYVTIRSRDGAHSQWHRR